jgi:neutral ceramidase
MFTEGFAAGRELLMGVAHTVITPPMGSEMSGFIARHSGMIGVHDHLYARAMVWSNGNNATRAVLLTFDLIGLELSTVEAIRQRITARTAIPQERIAVTTTHTHGGPSVMEGRLGGHVNEDYLDFIQRAAVDTVEEAANKLVPVYARFTIGDEPTVGKNRRISGGIIDSSVPIVRFDAMDGRVHAILLSYACHPVTLGADNYLITADYPGYTVRALEAVYPGAHLQFVTGCCGQINTGHSAQDSVKGRGLERRTYAECQRLGHLIAGAALQASERGAAPSGVTLAKVPDHTGNAQIKVLRTIVELPLLPVESPDTLRHNAEQYRKDAARLQRNGTLTGEGLMLQAWAEWAERTSLYAQPPRSIRSEIMLFAIGEISILLLPGEPFVEIGLEIKQYAKREALMVIGYSNGNSGYIPHRSAYESGGYEVAEAYRFYNYSSAFAPEAGEMLVEEALRMLSSL